MLVHYQCQRLLTRLLLLLAGIFTGFVYLSLYLAGKLMIFHQSGRGHSLRLLLVLTPLLVATMVAISRVRDYWHHWEGS